MRWREERERKGGVERGTERVVYEVCGKAAGALDEERQSTSYEPEI